MEIVCISCNIFQALKYIMSHKKGNEISTLANNIAHSASKSASSISQMSEKASKFPRIIPLIFRRVLCINKN
jgi:hypothetical protein